MLKHKNKRVVYMIIFFFSYKNENESYSWSVSYLTEKKNYFIKFITSLLSTN